MSFFFLSILSQKMTVFKLNLNFWIYPLISYSQTSNTFEHVYKIETDVVFSCGDSQMTTGVSVFIYIGM